MKKYISFFRLRFLAAVSYRTAALAQGVTQFLWGLMECLAYRAFWQADRAAFPMEYTQMAAYIWLQQACFAMFTVWSTDNEIFEMIVNGNVSYELCRPVSVYQLWFARTGADRLAVTALRCVPVLLPAVLLPKPYGLPAPECAGAFALFIVTLALSLGVTAAFCMLVYMLAFFTVSPRGLRTFLTASVEFLSGAIVPIPFFPASVQKFFELLPFAAMQNVPLRIYSGQLAGAPMYRAMGLQIFWLAVLVTAGKLISLLAQRRMVVQGG